MFVCVQGWFGKNTEKKEKSEVGLVTFCKAHIMRLVWETSNHRAIKKFITNFLKDYKR